MREPEDENEKEGKDVTAMEKDAEDGSSGRVCSSRRNRPRTHTRYFRPESTEIDRRAVLFTAHPPAGCIVVVVVVVGGVRR